MNITDIRLIHKEQTPIGDEYSSRPSFVMEHNQAVQDIIAEKHLYGNASIFDLAINYNTSAKKVKQYIANYNGIAPTGYSVHKDKIVNLSKLCSNTEISVRTGVSIGDVGRIISIWG